MKNRICLVAALAASMFAPVAANAGATVWMRYTGGSASNGDLNVVQDGAAGRQLILEKPDTGTATFSVDLVADVDSGNSALASTSTTFSTGSSNIAVTEATSTLFGPTNSPDQNTIEPGFAPGNLLTDFGQYDFFFGLGSGNGLVLGQMTFFIDKQNPGEESIEIEGKIGHFGWALLSGIGISPVQFGDGPSTTGASFGQSAGTFATIHNIPEPATLGLLCLSAVLLPRRSR